MTQAIVTVYHGHTNDRPAYIEARAGRNKVRISMNTDGTEEQIHRKAAATLCRKLRWPGKFATGCLPNGDRVHVFLDQ